ncbi:hypothetical protein Q1695_011225 [Nippostrongylus brasiliensis]|nr:hypothetical protein Q1695_011225 [Nippostrongylus brasiliensis]
MTSSRSLAENFDSASNEFGCDVSALNRSKSSNPFKKSSPLKKRRKEETKERVTFDGSINWDDSNANDPFSNEDVLFRRVSSKKTHLRLTVDGNEISTKDILATDFSDIFGAVASTSKAESNLRSSEVAPVDLRLGTKLKIVSKKPFPWMRDSSSSGVVPIRITGQQLHEGLQIFLQTVATNFSSSSPTDYPKNASPIALLESACLYWQFPSFSWLSTYPRMDSLVGTVAGSDQAFTLPQACLEALDIQWTECFDKLYLSWKKGDRRSFYMSCSSFTVLFTKISIGDAPALGEESSSCFQAAGGLRHVAVVAPSTIGFRQYLKSEGVGFEVIRRKNRQSTKPSTSFKIGADEESMPGFDWGGVTQSQPPIFFDRASSNQPTSDDKENAAKHSDSDESPAKGDLSGDHEWLENIGMSPRNTAKLKRYKSLGSSSNLASDVSHSNPDLEDVVAVLVKGAEVQTLYNLLQSSRVCRSIAGPHANLPPTLIAAQPFLHAEMHSLTKTSQVIRRAESEYVLELDGGPIMPHTINLIVEFIRRTALCSEHQTVLRVTDRAVCSGLNEIDPELCDWNELRVDMEKFWFEQL